MEDEEALEPSALLGLLADLFQDKVHNFFAYGVVPASVVVGRIFLACIEGIIDGITRGCMLRWFC